MASRSTKTYGSVFQSLVWTQFLQLPLLTPSTIPLAFPPETPCKPAAILYPVGFPKAKFFVSSSQSASDRGPDLAPNKIDSPLKANIKENRIDAKCILTLLDYFSN